MNLKKAGSGKDPTCTLWRSVMQPNTIFSTILLLASNFAWASGGTSLDSVEQHTSAATALD